ncbi:WD40/YVTN/BNR-like repeat-containing protein [Paenibacillus wenxiniae]|uniref:Glycosyl hydrolase n=1 Tax=Paenibacillus wenxiniae TaxID=1636843 RepID=A0ABW4RMQ8_9BACL
MNTFILAFNRELLIAEKQGESWNTCTFFKGANPVSLAVDPYDPNIIYCATFDRGLWKTYDGGHSWEAIDIAPAFGEFARPDAPARNLYTAIAVAADTEHPGHAIVYAGTEPSSVVRSTDGGYTLERLTDFAQASSKDSWFFPQRPHTHHVKHIAIHPSDPNIVYATIEVGGLFYSTDRGVNWTEMANAPRDIHELYTHPQAPSRLYAALGDSFLKEHHLGHGYAESLDNGATWEYIADGLEHHYVYQLAVDPHDPDTVLIAASSSPRNAHEYQDGECESFIYRKQKNKRWELITTGLPPSKGTLVSVLSVNKQGQFFVFNNQGVYISDDRGWSWERIHIPWTPSYIHQHPYDMIVLD